MGIDTTRNTGSPRIDSIVESVLDPDLYFYGFANLDGCLPESHARYVSGLSVVRRLDHAIINRIAEFPTNEYLDHYHAINNELNEVTSALVARFEEAGIEALGVTEQPYDLERPGSLLSVPISHKLTATRAGLGWIGKTDLLITKKAGPRVRLASVLFPEDLTDRLAKCGIEYGVPVTQSMCGACRICVDACPAQAADGTLWAPEIHRDTYFDAAKCKAHCTKVSWDLASPLNPNRQTICGRCVALCPHGLRAARSLGTHDPSGHHHRDSGHGYANH